MQSRKAVRIKAIRDAALAIVRLHGEWERIHNFPHPVLGYENEGFKLLYRTPFQPIPVSNKATSQGIAPSTQRAMYKAYGLDIWFGKKVLSVQWDQEDEVEVISYRKGEWEEKLLAHGHSIK